MRLRIALVSVALALSVLFPRAADAAVLSMDPATSTYGPGDTFISTIRLDNGSDCINAINVELTYPKDILRAVDFSRGDSILSLWAVEPKIDVDKGMVTFAGGIPGGYCGRIVGDAALSNVLGDVVFTVIGSSSPAAHIEFTSASKAYINDGQGTPATLETKGETVTIAPAPVNAKNPWLEQVGGDTTPPQPFNILVESTDGVFNGKYYIVFSTTDKESGLDHYEIYEGNGWKRVTSPYLLRDQSLLGIATIQLRAVDKAGNYRLGTYSASSTPQRRLTSGDFMPFIVLAIALFVALLYARLKRSVAPPSA